MGIAGTNAPCGFTTHYLSTLNNCGPIRTSVDHNEAFGLSLSNDFRKKRFPFIIDSSLNNLVKL